MRKRASSRQFVSLATERSCMQYSAFTLSSCRSPRLLRLVAVVFGALLVGCHGGEALVAGADSCHYSTGLICYRNGLGKDTRLHLLRSNGDKMETLFVTNTWGTIRSPICFADCVVATKPNGEICKFDLSGRLVYSKKLEGNQGGGKGSHLNQGNHNQGFGNRGNQNQGNQNQGSGSELPKPQPRKPRPWG